MKLKLPDGLHIYYEYHQKDENVPTLVFLNGLSQSTLSWFAITEVLKNQFNILLIDNIFQGKSDNKGHYRSFEQHASDVVQVVKKTGARRLVPVGISYGGAVVMRWLTNFPENIEKAVLISTFAHKTPYFDFIGTGWRRALLSGGYDLMFDVMLPSVLGEDYFLNPLIPIADIREARLQNQMTAEALLNLMEATERSGDYRHYLKEIKVPVKVIHGEQDILTTPQMGQAIADAIPNASLEILKRKGHTLNLEAIPELITIIEEFVS